MATRRYSIGPGESKTVVTESVGAATNSKPVEVTIDLGATIIGGNGVARLATQAEVIQALEGIKDYIISKNWPPA